MQHAIKTGKIASSNLAGSILLLLHVLRLLLSPKGAMVELETLSSSSCCKILVVEVVSFLPRTFVPYVVDWMKLVLLRINLYFVVWMKLVFVVWMKSVFVVWMKLVLLRLNLYLLFG